MRERARNNVEKCPRNCAHRPDFRDFRGLSSAAGRDIDPMTDLAPKSTISDEELAAESFLANWRKTPDDPAAWLLAYDLALHGSLSRRHDNRIGRGRRLSQSYDQDRRSGPAG